MARALKKRSTAKRSTAKRSTAKFDIIMKAKATTTRIVDINNEIVRLESDDKGQVTQEFTGTRWKQQC